MDPADREKYNARVKEWTEKHDEYLKEHPYLRKNPKRLAPGYTGNGKPTVLPQGKVNLKADSNEVPNEIKEAIKGSNPLYGAGPQYGCNCQRAVQAYELRRRGYNVRALPAMFNPKEEQRIIWGNECFVDSNGNVPLFKHRLSEATVKSIVSDGPDGSRYVIYVRWKDDSNNSNYSAHDFIAEKKDGKIYYIDPMTGNTNVEDYFSQGISNAFGLLRLDDKQIRNDKNIISQTVTWSD